MAGVVGRGRTDECTGRDRGGVTWTEEERVWVCNLREVRAAWVAGHPLPEVRRSGVHSRSVLGVGLGEGEGVGGMRGGCNGPFGLEAIRRIQGTSQHTVSGVGETVAAAQPSQPSQQTCNRFASDVQRQPVDRQQAQPTARSDRRRYLLLSQPLSNPTLCTPVRVSPDPLFWAHLQVLGLALSLKNVSPGYFVYLGPYPEVSWYTVLAQHLDEQVGLLFSPLHPSENLSQPLCGE